MDKENLLIKLKTLGIGENEYNLGGKPIREFEIGLMNTSGHWQVYQSLEKRDINIIEIFDNEKAACELLLKYLVMRNNKKWNRNLKVTYIQKRRIQPDPSFFVYNLNELFRETISLNTIFSSDVCFGSTLK